MKCSLFCSEFLESDGFVIIESRGCHEKNGIMKKIYHVCAGLGGARWKYYG